MKEKKQYLSHNSRAAKEPDLILSKEEPDPEKTPQGENSSIDFTLSFSGFPNRPRSVSNKKRLDSPKRKPARG